jgi:serine/threonine protein kinase
MAPELLNGRKCTASVDVYSFGVLAWEVCTGEGGPLPAPARRPAALLPCPLAACTPTPAPLRLLTLPAGECPRRGSMRDLRVPEECPQAVADLVAACLQEEAAARPTARLLLERLTALAGE